MCPSDAPPAYSSSLADNDATETHEEKPISYGYEVPKPTNPTVSTTECTMDKPRQSSEPTPPVDRIPKYSKLNEEPKQTGYSYNNNYKIPRTNEYASSSTSWGYLGCFSDSPARVVQGGGPKGFFRGDVSNRKCMHYCKSNGFSTAGTKNGKECWCGHSIAENVQLLPATACSTTCQGESSDYCGGTWAVSIYSSDEKTWVKPKYGALAELLALN